MKKILAYCMAIVALMLTSCGNDGWKVSGTIENAPDTVKVAIQGLGPNGWYNIDSVQIGSNGSFQYVSPEGSPFPDIYRISYNGRAIYFPIDSIESVTIKANALNFDRDYTLSGSPLAEKMVEIDKKIADFVAANGPEAAVTDSVFKRQLSETITEDQSGVLAYYLLNKTIGDRPMFSADSRQDVRMLGAVANKFATMFPNDPRTAILADRYKKARAATSTVPGASMEANVTGLIDLKFYDTKGKQRSLSDVAKAHGATLLSFTSYNLDTSVEYNVVLNGLYEKYKDKNIEIYQIALDGDEVDWRTKAQNLPWVAVRANPDEVQSLLSIYNVGVLPTTFIIDGNADIVERVIGDPEKIESALRKHLK